MYFDLNKNQIWRMVEHPSAVDVLLNPNALSGRRP